MIVLHQFVVCDFSLQIFDVENVHVSNLTTVETYFDTRG